MVQYLQARTQALNLLAWVETLVSAGHATRHILVDLVDVVVNINIVKITFKKHSHSLERNEQIHQNMTDHMTSRY
jgi:hypothetical protein